MKDGAPKITNVSASHRHFADEDIVLTVPTCLPHICTRRAFWPKIVLIGEHFSFESGDKDGVGQDCIDRKHLSMLGDHP